MAGVLGEPALDKAGMNRAHATLVFLLANAGTRLAPEVGLTIARAVVKDYVKAARTNHRHRLANVHPDTVRLSQMEIGQKIRVPMMARSILHNRMRTARKLIGSRAPRWRCREWHDVGQIEITRTEDGQFPERDPWDNTRACFLASIPLGQSRIAACFKNRQSMSTQLKVAARKLLGNHKADWSARTTNLGVSVRRTK